MLYILTLLAQWSHFLVYRRMVHPRCVISTHCVFMAEMSRSFWVWPGHHDGFYTGWDRVIYGEIAICGIQRGLQHSLVLLHQSPPVAEGFPQQYANAGFKSCVEMHTFHLYKNPSLRTTTTKLYLPSGYRVVEVNSCGVPPLTMATG